MTLQPLATVPDLVERLGRSLEDGEEMRVNRLLVDVSGRVRSYTRQEVFRRESTVRLRPLGGSPRMIGSRLWSAFARLPQRPVNDVSAVTDIDGNDVLFVWPGGALVYVRQVSGPIDVTYDHGWDDDNDELGIRTSVAGVVCQAVARALGQNPEESGTITESTDGYSETRGMVAAAGAFGLLDEERETLDSLVGRVRARTVRLG